MVNTTSTNKTIATNKRSVDERLTVAHIGHGPRVPCRDVRIEGCIFVEHYMYTNNKSTRTKSGGGEEAAMNSINIKYQSENMVSTTTTSNNK